MKKLLAVIGTLALLTSPAFAAETADSKAPSIEYRVVIVTTTTLGWDGKPKTEKIREESEKKLSDALAGANKDGWRLTTASVMPVGAEVTHYLYFERSK